MLKIKNFQLIVLRVSFKLSTSLDESMDFLFLFIKIRLNYYLYDKNAKLWNFFH